MITIPHELHEEFPRETALIEQLTKTSHDFGRLVSQYNEINQSIFRIESGEAPTTDEVLEILKKQRLKLKDEIAEFLRKCERRM